METLSTEKRREIAKSVGQMLHNSTHLYSVALVDFDTLGLGSGTLVDIGTRTFVCTAGHVLPPTVNGRLFLLGDKARKFGEGMPAYLNHGAVDKNGIDVGFVEVDRLAVLPWVGNKACLPLELIADLGTGNPKMMTAMTGFPGDTVGDPLTTGKFVPAYCAVNNLPFAAADYPTKVEPVPAGAMLADPANDVFLEYDDNGGIRDLVTYQKVELIKVPGMSGGGYYDWGVFAADKLWSPASMRLYAIQSSWCPRANNAYVRGTQIIYWLKLIADNYPDLASDLVAKYPRIKTVTF